MSSKSREPKKQYVSISRRKQREPKPVDEVLRKQKKRAAERALMKKELEKAKKGVLKKRKLEAPIAAKTSKKLTKKKKTRSKATIEDFDGADDDSSSLSAGTMDNTFEELKSTISSELSGTKKKSKKRRDFEANGDLLLDVSSESDDDDDESDDESAYDNRDDANDDSQEPDYMRPGVIYLSRLPWGFHETQMEQFFGQFGEVLAVRLARSKKTGRSKRHAFVKFRRCHVASVVAESMNGYFIFGRRMRCEVVPREKWTKNMFKKVKLSAYTFVERQQLAAQQHSATRLASAENHQAAAEKRMERHKKRMEHLKSLGIDLDDFNGSAATKKKSKKAKSKKK